MQRSGGVVVRGGKLVSAEERAIALRAVLLSSVVSLANLELKLPAMTRLLLTPPSPSKCRLSASSTAA